MSKAFRKSFSIIGAEMPQDAEDIPPHLIKRDVIDVTALYVEASDVKVPLKYPFPKEKKHAVICTYDNKKWAPQDWGIIEGDTATFSRMGIGIAYVAMYFDNNTYYPLSDPFVLSDGGQLKFLAITENKRHAMVLTRKYPLYPGTQARMELMVGMRFQGANKSDFSDAVNLFTISKTPDNFEEAQISNTSKFRYVRYISNLSKKGDIAELEFYTEGAKGSGLKKLSGKIIGYPEVSEAIGYPYQNAFDGDLGTFFHANEKNNYVWAGLDLGSPQRITKVKYCPRTDTNFIEVGDNYELNYWHKGKWVSMGSVIATDRVIQYRDVPSGTLYVLHNLTKGNEERIFTYENGTQVWW